MITRIFADTHRTTLPHSNFPYLKPLNLLLAVLLSNRSESTPKHFKEFAQFLACDRFCAILMLSQGEVWNNPSCTIMNFIAWRTIRKSTLRLCNVLAHSVNYLLLLWFGKSQVADKIWLNFAISFFALSVSIVAALITDIWLPWWKYRRTNSICPAPIPNRIMFML